MGILENLVQKKTIDKKDASAIAEEVRLTGETVEQVLKKHNVTATIFVTVDYIGTKKQFWWDSVADTVLGSSLINGEAMERVGMIDDINYSLKRQ